MVSRKNIRILGNVILIFQLKGGAERLVVDAALGLQNEGHKVQIFTSHCDKSHCFEEVKNETLKTKVYGDFLPTNFLQKFKILFACLRQLFLVIMLVISGEISEYDYFIVDQLSICLPILHLFQEKRSKTLFYCHFPDQLLAKRTGLIRKIYRLPFDLIEQFTMSTADSIVVNSGFTKTVYDRTFTLIKDFNVPDVIYPCVDLSKETITKETQDVFNNIVGEKTEYFLSINRFENKKNIELAIKSYKKFLEKSSNSQVKLIVAGGYDHRVEENKQYLAHLEKLSADLNLETLTIFNNEYSKYSNLSNNYNIIFLPSISSNLKELLLSQTKLLIYTPSFEHFGIVPLEAMKFGVPVIAVNNGGPIESIISIDENPELGTGWLEPSDPTTWSEKLSKSLEIPKSKLIKNGSIQLNSKFSLKVMTESFERNMLKTLKKPREKYTWETGMMLWKLPVFFILRKYFGLEPILVWGLTSITFLPPSMFQFVALVALVGFYKLRPDYFQYYT